VAGISWQEWLGYIASALVLVSLSMSSIARLRWFNLAGAICFAAYGVLIEAWPVALMNTAIAGVNVYYLIQLYTREDYFKTLMVSPQDAYLREFIDFHGDDIRRWYPDFDGCIDEEAIVVIVLRNVAVAGIFAGTIAGNGCMNVLIDYVIPEYADRKVGTYLYRDNRDMFRSWAVSTLTVDPSRINNESYFRRMGFRPGSGSADGRLELALHPD
jgi:hypothetical protein